MTRIEYPLFIDLDLNHVPYAEKQRMVTEFRKLPYWRGIDPKGRVWLGFSSPQERNLTRDGLNYTLSLRMGYRTAEVYETITGFKKLQ